MSTSSKTSSNPKKIVLSPLVKICAGMAGGAAEALCLFPLDTIKTRLQMDFSGQYKGIAHCGRTILANEGGPRALYKGLTPFLTHLVVKYAYRFGSFEYVRQTITKAAAKRNYTNATSINFVSGLTAGVSEAILIVTPFEVIKTRLQTNTGSVSNASERITPFSCARTMIRQEGLSSLMKGVVPTMIRQGSNQAMNFMMFMAINKHIWGKGDGDGKEIAVWKTFATGIVAGMAGPCLNCPMDVVKTRLMTQNTSASATAVPGQSLTIYRGAWHCMVTIAKEEGIRALWKGLIPRLLRLAPGQGITWVVVSKITTFFEQQALREQHG